MNLKTFEDLDFDLAAAPEGHRQRFRQKLEAGHKGTKNSPKYIWLWPVLGVAASFILALLLFGIFFGPTTKSAELSSISSEMKQTQQFYHSVITSELSEIKKSKDSSTQRIVNDALAQLKILDKEYSNLSKDLAISGKDQRVAYAMILNLQQRAQLLQNLMQQIEEIKSIKSKSHENNRL